MQQTRKKVLCIEDDRETATLIAEELTERGYDVEVAHDGREGFAAILRSRPDIVVSDISMPVMSGFELLERLTALVPRFRNMPFVFLTALTDRDNELKGRQLGADDYVTKPLDFDRLDAIIAARLAGVARNELWSKQVDLNEREVETLTADLGDPAGQTNLGWMYAKGRGVPKAEGVLEAAFDGNHGWCAERCRGRSRRSRLSGIVKRAPFLYWSFSVALIVASPSLPIASSS